MYILKCTNFNSKIPQIQNFINILSIVQKSSTYGQTQIHTYKWNSFVTFCRDRAKRNSTDQQKYTGNLYLVCLKFCTRCLSGADRNAFVFPFRGKIKEIK